MATGGNEGMSDETFNFKCTSCVKINRHREAVKYCVDCQGYCCQSCVDSHEMFPALINHNLLDKSGFQSTTITAGLPAVPTERCRLHETNIVNVYCGNHDVVGCSTCIVLDHRNCKDVHSIPGEIETLFKKSDVVKTCKDLQEMKTKITERMRLRQKLLEELAKSKIEAICAIKDFKADMVSILERLENEILNEVENEFRKLKSTLKEEMKRAENELKGLEQTADDLQKSDANNAQQFVSMKNVAKTLSRSEELSRLFEKQINAKITFVSNTDILDALHNLKLFGSVKNTPSSNLKRTTVYTVNAKRDLNIKLQSDNATSNVDGSCITDDGLLLLADYSICLPEKKANDTYTHKEAVKYCVECQGYCCQSCVDSHEMFPALINHNLLDKLSFKSSILTADLPAVPTERCKLHETNIVNIYCGDHDVVGCSTCMVLDHRNCKDVHSIPDEIETLFQKTDVTKIYNELQEMKTMIAERMKLRQNFLEELTKSKIEAIHAIKEFKAEMVSILERLENESLNEVENEFRKLESTLKEEMKKAENELKGLEQTADDLQKSEGNNAQQFVSMKNVAKSLSHAEEVSRLFDKPTNAKITFVFNTDIRDVLHRRKTFGSVKNAPLSNVKRTTLYTIKAKRDLNIKLQSDDSTSNVQGSCITEDGMLLLADYANSKLKRADIGNMSVVEHCVLPAPPYSVCCTSQHEAAVSLQNTSILFVALRNLMTPTRQINLNHVCYGIAYKDNKLYITDADRALYMYDIKGKLLQKVSTDSSGYELFQNSRNVSISECADRVYVGDWYKRLITLDTQGTHVDTFMDKDLSNALGVCTDNSGNVFVCGWGSHNVLQIAEEGNNKEGVVVQQSDGIYKPMSICFDRNRCVLVVTQQCNDTVKVLELQ